MANELDVAQRLSLRGWLQVHQGRLNAHVVAPQTWEGLREQFMQHSLAQHRAAARHWLPLLASRRVSWPQKLDGFMSHSQVFLPAMWVLAGGCVLSLYLLGAAETTSWGLALLALAACSSLGHWAPHFQGVAAARTDGRHRALRLSPMQWCLAVPGLLAHAALSMRLAWQAIRRVGPVASLPLAHVRKAARPTLGGGGQGPGSGTGVIPSGTDATSSTWVSRSEAA
jgi:hypothetical protein